MSGWQEGLITQACMSAGALAGYRLQASLPEHHPSEESKDVMKLVTGPRPTTRAAISRPRSRGALLLGALAIASAVFLIEELGRPLDGWIAVSREPLLRTLEILGQ